MSDDATELQRMKREGFKRLEKVFEAFDQDLQVRVHISGSMETILKDLGDFPARVFKLLYTKTEWENMCTLDDAIRREEKTEEPKKTTSPPKRPREKLERPKKSISKIAEKPVINKEVRTKKKQKSVPATKISSKKNPEMLKKLNKKEEEEEEEEDCEYDTTDELPVSQQLLKMKESVIVVCEILPKLSSKFLSNEKLVPPNPEDAQEDHAEALLRDMERLGTILDENVGQYECTTEKVGKLYSWWRVCRRAFAFESLLSRFKTKRKTTKEEQFTEFRDRLIDSGIACCGYRNALKYVRLSKFLRTFPLFIYQTEFLSLRQWIPFLGKGRLANDSFFDKDFWSQRTLSEY